MSPVWRSVRWKWESQPEISKLSLDALLSSRHASRKSIFAIKAPSAWRRFFRSCFHNNISRSAEKCCQIHNTLQLKDFKKSAPRNAPRRQNRGSFMNSIHELFSRFTFFQSILFPPSHVFPSLFICRRAFCFNLFNRNWRYIFAENLT